MDGRGPAQVRAGHPGGAAAGHARPPGERRSTRSIRQPKVGRPRDWSTLTMLGRCGTWRATAAPGGGCRSAPLAAAPDAYGAGSCAGGCGRCSTGRWRVLVACRRLAAGRKRRPTAAIIDTQSVRTGPQRGPRGYDAHKKVKGRKRVLMVDTQGDPLGVRVVPADVQDRDALPPSAPDLAAHAPSLPRLAGPRLRRRRSGRLPARPRHRRRGGRHARPPGLPGRAAALEGRADLRLPAALPPPARRRRGEHRRPRGT